MYIYIYIYIYHISYTYHEPDDEASLAKNTIPGATGNVFPQPGSAVAIGVQEVAEKISEALRSDGDCEHPLYGQGGFYWEIPCFYWD